MKSSFSNSREALRRERLLQIEESKAQAKKISEAKARIGDNAALIISNNGNMQAYRKTEEQIKADNFSKLFKRMMKLHRGEIENPLDENGKPIDKRTALQSTINELMVDHYDQLRQMAPYVQTAGYNIDGLASLFEDKRALRTNIEKTSIDLVSERLYSILLKLKQIEKGEDHKIDDDYRNVASKYPKALKGLLKNPNIKDYANNAQLNKLATGGIFSYSAAFRKRVEVEGKDSLKEQVYSALDHFLKNEERKISKSETTLNNVESINKARQNTSSKVKKVVNA